MPEAIEVIFKGRRLDYFVNPDRVQVGAGDPVIVEAERGIDMGTVAHLAVSVDPPDRGGRFRSIVRRAESDDERTLERMRAEETEAVRICRERVRRLRLDMKVVDAETQFDGNRITFYFTAEQRVDFRELVRDLASIFKTRIELRQIGARDAAKRIGGIGPCGREYCCSTWLKGFSPVTLKMAKNQGLALAPSKISGGCGRLMCCLMYEDPFYREMVRMFPKVGTKVEIEGRPLMITGNNYFREAIRLQDIDGNAYEFPLDEFPIAPQAWGGAVRPRGADTRGGEGSGCGKTDPQPIGMKNAKPRAIPIEKAEEPKGAPFMRGGKERPEPPAEAPEGTPPADLVRYTAQARRQQDGDALGSGTSGGNGEGRRDARDSKLVASAEPEGGSGTTSPPEGRSAPDKGRRPEGDRRPRGGRRPRAAGDGGRPRDGGESARSRDRSRPEGDRPREDAPKAGAPKADAGGESSGQVDHHGSRPEHPAPRRRRRRRRRRDGKDTGGTGDSRGNRPEAKK